HTYSVLMIVFGQCEEGVRDHPGALGPGYKAAAAQPIERVVAQQVLVGREGLTNRRPAYLQRFDALYLRGAVQGRYRGARWAIHRFRGQTRKMGAGPERHQKQVAGFKRQRIPTVGALANARLLVSQALSRHLDGRAGG